MFVRMNCSEYIYIYICIHIYIYIYDAHYLFLTQYAPAMGGPTVSGIAHIPRMNPMPCDAPAGPQMSYAIGPNIVIKHPSKSPIIREITIIAGYAPLER